MIHHTFLPAGPNPAISDQGGGGKKDKIFRQLPINFPAIKCKTIDTLFNILFESVQISDEIAVCDPLGGGGGRSASMGFGPGCQSLNKIAS